MEGSGGAKPPSGNSVRGVWGAKPPSGISVTRALPPCFAPNFFSFEKLFDRKNFRPKIFRPKTFSAEKCFGRKSLDEKQLGARHGGKAWVTEIPEGGFATPDPPTTTFQKICPPDKFFEMIKKRRLRIFRPRSVTVRPSIHKTSNL